LAETPRVSVLLTSYNYGDYIQESIRSVFAQTYGGVELVIVDDGSSDNSPALIDAACAQSPIYVKKIFKENEGQASAINVGFEACRGDIIALLDSDDFWYPEKLAHLVACVGQNPEGGVYQHQLDTHYGKKRNSVMSADVFGLWKSWGRGILNIPDDHATLCFSPFLPTSALGFRRGVLEKILPVPKSLRTCPDAYLTRCAVCHGALYSIPQSLGFWRDHGENMTHNAAFGFHEFWLPTVLPELNKYYRSAGAGFQLIYEPELRSRLGLARLFGQCAGPFDGVELAGAVRETLTVPQRGLYALEFELAPSSERSIRLDTAVNKQRRLPIVAECAQNGWTRVVTGRTWRLEAGEVEVWISPSSLAYVRAIRLREVEGLSSLIRGDLSRIFDPFRVRQQIRGWRRWW
jgi:glycosyltransferase involved in cell wall biosynthesis